MSIPAFSDKPALTGRTGTCEVCGGADLPIVARLIAEHPERVVRRVEGGQVVEVEGDRRCDGSLQPPEPGTEERPPRARRRQIL